MVAISLSYCNTCEYEKTHIKYKMSLLIKTIIMLHNMSSNADQYKTVGHIFCIMFPDFLRQSSVAFADQISEPSLFK
jgi:hypothetical protein